MMALGLGSYGLSLLAGMLSTLSPCVLPLLPIIFGSAVAAHRFGALALAAGLGLSFVSIGLFVATLGFSLGLDDGVFRWIGASVLLGIGIVLLSEVFQARLAVAVSPLAAGVHGLIERLNPAGLRGQFLLGLLIGLVWSPCVGPTMGAAATLAARRQDLLEVAALMIIFGLGAALPMLLIGTLSREVITRLRGGMAHAGRAGKRVLGAFMVVLASFILTGIDKSIESVLVAWSPGWLTKITTLF
jgi:cytochrome c-type biogenesis protein